MLVLRTFYQKLDYDSIECMSHVLVKKTVCAKIWLAHVGKGGQLNEKNICSFMNVNMHYSDKHLTS